MPLSDYRVISTSDLKDMIGWSGSTLDTQLDALNDAVTRQLEERCGTAFIQRSFTENHKGSYQPVGLPFPPVRKKFLYLERAPIVSVTSITDPKGNTILARDYGITKETAKLRHLSYWAMAVDSNYNEAEWTIVYTAGVWATTANVDDSALKLAVAKMVTRHLSSPVPGVTSRTSGGVTVGYGGAQVADIPEEVLQLIGHHVRPDVR